MRRLLTRPAVVLAALLSVVVGVLLLDGGGPGPATKDRTDHAGHAYTFADEQKAAIVAQAAAPLLGSEFRADCFPSHRRGDDPIVFPGQAGLTLAGTRNGANVTTAPGCTFHGDFLNAWDEGELKRRVSKCVNEGYISGTDGNPIQQ